MSDDGRCRAGVIAPGAGLAVERVALQARVVIVIGSDKIKDSLRRQGVGCAARGGISESDGLGETDGVVAGGVAAIVVINQNFKVGGVDALPLVGNEIENSKDLGQQGSAPGCLLAGLVRAGDRRPQNAEDGEQQRAGDQEFEQSEAALHGRLPELLKAVKKV